MAGSAWQHERHRKCNPGGRVKHDTAPVAPTVRVRGNEMYGWLFHGDARAARSCFSTGKSGERDRLPGRGAGPREAGGTGVSHTRLAASLAFFFCRNSTAAPPLPPFRALTKHTKRDRKSRPRQESYLQLPCPACLNAFAFRFASLSFACITRHQAGNTIRRERQRGPATHLPCIPIPPQSCIWMANRDSVCL